MRPTSNDDWKVEGIVEDRSGWPSSDDTVYFSAEITELPLWGVDNGQETADDEGRTEVEAPGEEQTSHLATQTRLYNTAFDNQASTHIEIESTEGLRLQTKALGIVKEAWYSFCHCYQWFIWRGFFLSGPPTILLETPIVQICIDHWHNDNVPGVTYLGASSALRFVTPLRNAVCHYKPEQWDAVGFDRLLQNSQALAVALNDEPRALQVRQLRDELRGLAAETLQEIEALGFASITPSRREWKPHHEWFLQNAAARADHGVKGYHHGTAVWLAVEAWRWQRQSFGLDHRDLEGGNNSLENLQPGNLNIKDKCVFEKEDEMVYQEHLPFHHELHSPRHHGINMSSNHATQTTTEVNTYTMREFNIHTTRDAATQTVTEFNTHNTGDAAT
ncbi:uncharacterized protein PG986_002744 [Apiospora aurea]|uniref:HNH nuclease domain-containing protein n=1 Tax=Apiospora aurea TaxID=335848 RepID=A0ABR1QQA0_9PEZI